MQDFWEPRLIRAENSNAVRGSLSRQTGPSSADGDTGSYCARPSTFLVDGSRQGLTRVPPGKVTMQTRLNVVRRNMVQPITLSHVRLLCSLFVFALTRDSNRTCGPKIKGQVLSKPKRQRNPFGFSQWFITLSLIGISYIFQFFLFQDISFPSLVLDGGASLSFHQLGPALCISKLALCGQQTLILTLGNLVLFVLLLSQPPVWD